MSSEDGKENEGEDEKEKFVYYNLSNAVDDLKGSDGAKETALSGLKLLGKGLFNTARYTVTEALPAIAVGVVKVAEHAAKANLKQSESLLKDGSLSSEKREKLEGIRERSAKNLDDINSKKNP